MGLFITFIVQYLEKLEIYSFISILLVTLVIIVYSLLLGNLFGHRTFWKLKYRKKSILLVYHQIARKLTNLFSSKINNLTTTTSANNNSDMMMTRFPDPVLLEIFGFLDGYSLIKVAQCSQRSYKLVYKTPYLWTTLFQNTFQSNLLIDFINYLQSIQYRLADTTNIYSIRNYFLCLKKYPLFLLTRNLPNTDTVNVIVRGNVLYIPLDFVEEEHPGGGQIIHHYHMQDATTIFDISNHSEAALSQMNRYIRWSSQRYGVS